MSIILIILLWGHCLQTMIFDRITCLLVIPQEYLLAVSTQTQDNKVIIALNGNFDFNYYKEFRNAYKHIPEPHKKTFVVDFSRVNYIDSSALGMLLMLREHLGADSSRLILKQPLNEVLDILRISNFDRLMTFEH